MVATAAPATVGGNRTWRTGRLVRPRTEAVSCPGRLLRPARLRIVVRVGVPVTGPVR